MLDPSLFDDLVKKLSAVMPDSVRDIEQDIQSKIRAVLQSSFAKMDLVTREEFDVQRKVLARTRAKLEDIEQQIARLEQ